MPTTIEELEAAIQDTIYQANSILFLNHNILEEYESRQRKVCFIHQDNILLFFLMLTWKIYILQIKDLTNKQESDEKELKGLVDEINSLKVK